MLKKLLIVLLITAQPGFAGDSDCLGDPLFELIQNVTNSSSSLANESISARNLTKKLSNVCGKRDAKIYKLGVSANRINQTLSNHLSATVPNFTGSPNSAKCICFPYDMSFILVAAREYSNNIYDNVNNILPESCVIQSKKTSYYPAVLKHKRIIQNKLLRLKKYINNFPTTVCRGEVHISY